MEASRIIEDLRALGIEAEDTIIVHSSYNALQGTGTIKGGPAAVIEALKETVKNGTLLLPALSYENVSVENRIFDLENTPSCIGVLPEFMRLSEGVFRSVHPTHSVTAWGKDAEEITKHHFKDFSPVGPNSPFREVYRREGKIVMLGAPLARNTSLHGVEEMILPDYLFRGNFDYEIRLPDNKVMTMNVLRHDFSGYEQRYDRVLDILAKEDYQCGKVLQGTCCVMNAKAVWEKALVKYQEDSHYFVDKL
ncbi:AAC(3) family N-acetyltransferase [Vagococcus elongatus]|uniref:Aminoglycoside N(3)-acetyltransferase n=1 Tax=Vagococcus elongatus TaxID=180344 RepID=A0A430B4L5_9ENTE|nr:AAC(3) family N-acetyltransferase [Vagococcus elongatus]RSU15152.1 hypothetical protein CBF29_02125 [Vagococcus elongatus]